jgi:hypothetical protein
VKIYPSSPDISGLHRRVCACTHASGIIPVIFASLVLCGCPKSAADRHTSLPQQQSEPASPAASSLENQGKQVAADKENDQKGEIIELTQKKNGEADNQPSETGAASTVSQPENNQDDESMEKPRELGPPLVDHPEDLIKLHPVYPVWIDNKNKQIILIGSVCRANYPLEFFATYPDRGYESVVVIYAKPSVVHAALLALGAKPGKPVQYDPKFIPPSGAEVGIDVSWKDRNGKRQKARAQDWIRDIKTKKQLDVNWVFAGSMFWEDKETGEKSYLADRGDFISVLNLPTALLDVPIQSASAIESRLFEGFIERLPPPGTPVTLILKPKLEKSNTDTDKTP